MEMEKSCEELAQAIQNTYNNLSAIEIYASQNWTEMNKFFPEREFSDIVSAKMTYEGMNNIVNSSFLEKMALSARTKTDYTMKLAMGWRARNKRAHFFDRIYQWNADDKIKDLYTLSEQIATQIQHGYFTELEGEMLDALVKGSKAFRNLDGMPMVKLPISSTFSS